MKKLWENWRKYLTEDNHDVVDIEEPLVIVGDERPQLDPIYVPKGHPWLRKPHLLRGKEVRALNEPPVDYDIGSTPDPVPAPEPETSPKPAPTPEPKPETSPAPEAGKGKFVGDYEPPRDWEGFDDFYDKLDARGIELSRHGKDYKFGREHKAAWYKLQEPTKQELADYKEKYGFDEETTKGYFLTQRPYDPKVTDEGLADYLKDPVKYKAFHGLAIDKSAPNYNTKAIGWTVSRDGKSDFRYTPNPKEPDKLLNFDEVKNIHILTKDRWDPETKSWVPNEGDSPVLKHMKEFGFDEEAAVAYEQLRQFDSYYDWELKQDPKVFEKWVKSGFNYDVFPEGRPESLETITVDMEEELEESIYRATLKVLRERKLRKHEI